MTAQTDPPYLIEKLDVRETIRRVLEQVARQPIMVGDVVILREESAPTLRTLAISRSPAFQSGTWCSN